MRTAILSFVFAGVASGTLFSALGSASALELRVPSVICHAPWSSDMDEDEVAGTGDLTSVANVMYTTNVTGVICPFVERDTFRKTQVETLDVYVRDLSAVEGFDAAACWQAFGGSTYTCGGADGTGNSEQGYVTLNPSLSAWNSNYGSAVIVIEVPEGGSIVEGYRAAD